MKMGIDPTPVEGNFEVMRFISRHVAAALVLITLTVPALAADAPPFVPFQRLTAAATQAVVMNELGKHKFTGWYDGYTASNERYAEQERRFNALRDGKDVTWIAPVWADKFSDPKIIGRMGKCGAKFSTVINVEALISKRAKHKKFGYEDFLAYSAQQEEWGVFDLPDRAYATIKILINHTDNYKQVFILDTRTCFVNDERSLSGPFEHSDYPDEDYVVGIVGLKEGFAFLRQWIGKNSKERLADIEVKFLAKATPHQAHYKGKGLVFSGDEVWFQHSENMLPK
jgi:hypothetical protein